MAEDERVARRVDLTYRLEGQSGRSETTQSKSWFFDLPAARDSTPYWTELLNRLFYDANVAMRRREPNDANWLQLDGVAVSDVDLVEMLAWNGRTTMESAQRHLPWVLSAQRVVWEYTACHFIDDGGAYDGMAANDFTELMLARALAAGLCDDAGAIAFLERFYPGHGAEVHSERAERLANLTIIRPVPAFRKRPGDQPWVSGPPALADIG